MKKRIVSILLALLIVFTAVTPAVAASAVRTGSVSTGTLKNSSESFVDFFKNLRDRISELINRIKTIFQVKKECIRNTMNQNAIHMLKSVTNTIGDSFIITTDDGKVIVVDGGARTETDYFIEYLKAVTGRKKPHIDAWFLSHPHDDHCEVFNEIVGNRPNVLSFDKVYANFAEASYYEGKDDWAFKVLTDYYRNLPRFADKAAELHEGDVFNVGSAKFTVYYTFNPEWTNCNEASTIMKMELGGTSMMFNGDAGTNAGNYVVEKYGDALKCDYCKMAHHGQDGVGQNFYQAVDPDVCIWPTPSWVYENTNGNLKTFETRAWVEELGVKKEYKSFEGSVVIPVKPRIVTTTDVFEDGYPAETAVDRLASLGYEGIDMGFDYWTFDGSPFLSDDYLDWAAGLKERADEKGIVYTHAHAPGEADATDYVIRSIEAASVLGARYLVVHPIWHEKNGRTINTSARFIDVNKRAIKKYLAKAEECGVVLLSENILWGASKNPKIIADLVKAVGSDWFGWCFDVGHAWACGYAPDVLKKCAVVPMSLHIQDNDGSGDQHLIPGDGTIDFESFISTLKEIGYLGDCVLEAHHQSIVAPDAERDAILARLLEKAEEIRAEMR